MPDYTPDPRILGTGHAVPPSVRTNDDPYFDPYRRLHKGKSDSELFQGYKTRHVLADGETVVDLMVLAAQMAMRNAGVTPSQIDMLIGDASISDYLVPNGISEVHKKLGLSKSTWPLAVTTAFSQFNAAMMMADALIRAGRATYVLIALGDNWTRYVHPETPQALSAADGAAACVVGPRHDAAGWALVDTRTEVAVDYYGSMFMTSDLVAGPAGNLTKPYFQITDKGAKGFKEFAAVRPQELALQQLKATAGLRQVDGTWQDLSFICHQASSVLIDTWVQAIKPENTVSTLAEYGNMVHASTLFNLSWARTCRPDFTQNWLQSLCLGPDMHVNVSLFRRNF